MILGHSEVYHGFRQFNNVSECAFWIEGFKAKYDPEPGQKPFGREEFDQLLGHCSAACDTPTNAFGPELIVAYPGEHTTQYIISLHGMRLCQGWDKFLNFLY